MHADFKYQYGKGNKVDTISDIISLYGISNLNNNLTLHGLLSIGKIKAKQKIRRLIGLNLHKAATGKFTANIYSAQGILNYKISMNNNSYYLIPNIGVRFGRNYDGGYSEYGAGIYNLTASS